MAKHTKNKGLIQRYKTPSGQTRYRDENGKAIPKKVGELKYKAERDTKGRLIGTKKQREYLINKINQKGLTFSKKSEKALRAAQDSIKYRKIEKRKAQEAAKRTLENQEKQAFNYFMFSEAIQHIPDDKIVSFKLPNRVQKIKMSAAQAKTFVAELIKDMNSEARFMKTNKGKK